MVISMRKLASFLAISLVAAVISLETDAGAQAIMPNPTPLRSLWDAGFGPVIGKLAKDSAGNVYAVDVETRRILKFGPQLNLDPTLTVSTPTVFNVASFGTPNGIALLSGNRMVVTFLSPAPRVVMLDSVTGQQLTVAPGGMADLGRFQAPVAVTVDSQENIYVLDAGLMKAPMVLDAYGDPVNPNRYILGTSRPCVQVFTSAGAPYVTGVQLAANITAGYPSNSFSYAAMVFDGENPAYHEPGLLVMPEGMIYDSVNKQVIIADTLGGRVQFFGAADNTGSDANGAKKFRYLDYLGSMTPPSAALHMTMPVGLALDADPQGARLYVVDKVLHRVLVVDPALKTQLGVLNASTVSGLDLVFPRDVLVHKGHLLVASEQGARKANLSTIALGDVTWPLPNLRITFDEAAARTEDPNFPNLKKRTVPPATVLHTYPIIGDVDAGSSVTYSVNNNKTSGGCTVTGARYSCNVLFDITQVDQTVTITGVNGVNTGLVELPQINYYANNTTLPFATGPVLTFDPIPAAEQFRKTETITITGKVNYSAFANGSKDLVVEVATKIGTTEQPVRAKAVVDLSGGPDHVWTATVPLVKDAVNILTPYAYVEGSAKSTAASQTVTVDTIAPEIDWAFLPSNAVTTDQLQNASGVVVERNLDKLYLEINDVPIELSVNTLDAATGKAIFSAVALLSKNGVNTVRVRAIDKAGNPAVTPDHLVELKPWILDPANRLTVTSQADNFFYPHTGVQLSYAGKVPATTTDLTFGVESAKSGLSGTNWSHTTSTLLSNKNREIVPIEITATGDYGLVSKMRSLYYDPAFPGVKITTPVEDIATNAASVTFSYTVEPRVDLPANPITQITATLYDSANTQVYTETRTSANSYTTSAITLTGRANGVYTFKVTATDGTYTSVATRNIVYDTVKPSVGIALNYDPAMIEGYIEPGATVQVRYNGTLQPVSMDPLNPSHWIVTGGSYPDYSLITVKGIDIAGNINDRVWQTTQPNADVDGDGALRVTDAIVALRALVAGTPTTYVLDHGDISPLINGTPAPDGLLTLEDAVLVLRKVEGKTW